MPRQEMSETTADVMAIREVAEYLQMSRTSLYKLAREGKIPCNKVGRRWEFRKEEIERWRDERNNRLERGYGTRECNGECNGHALKPHSQPKQQVTKPQTVKAVTVCNHLKEVRLVDKRTTLLLPRSACVAQGDPVELTGE